MRRLMMSAFAACLVAGLAPLPSAQATSTVTSRRLAGPDRYATAAAVAVADRDTAQVAVLARGDDPADALAGSTLAGLAGGPVLLTARDRLSGAALDAMRQLEVRRVELLGGPDAISEGVAAELREQGFEVGRTSGADRYDTAARISASCGSTCGYPTVNGKRVALLVNGLRPADAAAASPIAAGLPLPLLLTERDRVPGVTLDALSGAGVEQVLVIGGEAVVSGAAVRSLQDAGYEVRRLAGASRQDTAAQLARFERDELGWVVDHVNLTRGDVLVDALAGGPHAGREQAPVLLTRDPDDLGSAARLFLEESQASVGSLDVFGGEGAVSAAVLDAAERAAGKAGPGCPVTTNPATPATPTTVARGLRVPWGLAVLPDGVALVSERDTARLRLVHPDGRVTDIGTIPGVVPGGEGGLLGIALSPTFSSDRLVYAYLTAGDENKVIRTPFDAVGSQVQTLVSGIPKASIHNGGRITFGPDGMLYIGTGDAARSSLSQDRSSLAGKVLRVRPDGSIPPDNPFPGSPVFSLGHRNVQGLGFDADGRLYATELGQNAFDEVNVLRAGGNYGWPVVEGRGGDPRFIEPVVTWTPAEASPSGAEVVAGSFWVAALRGQRLWQVQLDGAGGVGQVRHHFAGQYGRLRAVAPSPDCGLWVLTNESDARLLRIGLS